MKNRNIRETLTSMVGFPFGAYSKSGNFVEGVVEDVTKKYIIIKNRKKETKISFNDIIAVSNHTKPFEEKDSGYRLIQENSIMELLAIYEDSWVTLYCKNNLSFNGFLSFLSDDYVILSRKNKKLYVKKEYIISFYPEILKLGSAPKQENNKTNQWTVLNNINQNRSSTNSNPKSVKNYYGIKRHDSKKREIGKAFNGVKKE